MSTEAFGGLPGKAPTFGTDFNYAVWGPHTTVSLHNVRWNNDYRDVVKFRTQGELDAYLRKNQGPIFTNSRYARVHEPIRISVPFNDAYKYNYLRVENPAQPVGESGPRVFYYFIQDVQHVAPNTTEIRIQLDVWQTFVWFAQFGNCYVERGHIGVANANQFEQNGRQYLTIPEGFDIGNEYEISAVYEKEIGSTQNRYGENYHILVWASTQLVPESGGYGTLGDPNLRTARPNMFEFMANGLEMWWFADINDYVNSMSSLSNFPWVTQGITMVIAVPRMEIPSEWWEAVEHEVRDSEGMLWGYFKARRIVAGRSSENKLHNLQPNWRSEPTKDLGYRYRYLKKFLTYPYCFVELTTYSGTPIVCKPEMMDGDDLLVAQMTHYALPNPRVMFFPYRYNAAEKFRGVPSENIKKSQDGGEYLDMATGITSFPTFSVVNDSHLLYMASNAHSIAYQHTSADWTQQRALTANQLGYDQASAQMGLASQLTGMDIGAANQMMNLNNQTQVYRGVTGGVAGAAQGAIGSRHAGGAVVGALGSVADAAININQNTQSTAINNALMAGRNTAQVSNMGFMRDTNKDFADFAARGDYAVQIGAINAKVQDSKLIQPTTVGQVGGEAFLLSAHKWAVTAKVKRINKGSMAAIGEYWLRYGYAVNRFTRMPESFMAMTKFTYWKIREAYLTSGEMPETFKQTMRGIFEKGVTVWTNPDDIGTVDMATNEPMNGVRI